MNGTDKAAPERIWVLLKSGEAHFKKPTHFNADAPEYVHIDKVRELEAEVTEAAKIKAALRAAGIELNPIADGGGSWHYEARLAPDGVAVAWQYRWKIDGEYVNWRYSDASNYHRSLDGFEERPLYTHPASDTALREALEPFALIAEYDISESDADDDTYRPMEGGLAIAKPICIGDLRRALAALNPTEKNNG